MLKQTERQWILGQGIELFLDALVKNAKTENALAQSQMQVTCSE